MTQKELFDNINRESSVTEIQEYIDEVVRLRGFANQPIQEQCYFCLRKQAS